MLPFRERLTPAQRAAECARVLARRPTYVPAILVRGDHAAPAVDREKYLLPPDLTAAQLHYIVRRRLRMDAREALFLLCGRRRVGGETTVRQLQDAHRDTEDGFLYVTYTLEHAFGALASQQT